MGKKYEVGLTFIGNTFRVVYDPADITEVTIEYDGHAPWQARELVIGQHSGKKPTLPEHLEPKAANESRLLRGAEKKHTERQAKQLPAVSYRAVRKEAENHV
jgi:hypothetical protein